MPGAGFILAKRETVVSEHFFTIIIIIIIINQFKGNVAFKLIYNMKLQIDSSMTT